MNLTVEIPDDLARRLGAEGVDLSRSVREAFLLQEFRGGRLSQAELRQLLGIRSRYEMDGFLKEHDVWFDYTVEDFRQEMETLRSLGF